MNVPSNGLPIRGASEDLRPRALPESLGHLSEKIDADIKAPFTSQKSEQSSAPTAEMQVKVWNSKDGKAGDASMTLRIAQSLSHAFQASLGVPKAPSE